MQFPFWCVVCVLVVSLSAAQDAITCGEPLSIEFASLTSLVYDEYPLGANVSYVCQFGYVSDGIDRVSRCVLSQDGETATWTMPQMSCIPRSCGDPGYVPNGHRIGSVFTFPNFVTYECDDGFKLRGTGKRYCQASGSWSGRLPSCGVVTCDIPDDPENGYVSYSSLEYGAELKYECNEGYQLEDSENVYCTSDGTWSKTNIKCIEAKCDVPFAPEHGSVLISGTKDSPRAGTLAIFSCDEGRILHGPATSRCLEEGFWTFPPPECREPCNVPKVPNGRIGRYVKVRNRNELKFQTIPVGSRLEEGEKLFLHCDQGYDPLGGENWQAKIICNRGKWTDVPYCELASCRSKPPTLTNGIAAQISSKHGGTVLYECFPDFKKVKSGNVNCDRGVWKGTPPICKDTRCSVQQLEIRGLESGSKSFYRNGESIQIGCKQGYTPSTRNSGRLECENGTWKGSVSPCVPANCLDSPPSINHGRAVISSTAHGSTVKYVCEGPYMLEEDTEVQCQFGQWSGKIPKCKDSRCYVRDLKYRTGVSLAMESPTNSGEYLRVMCTEGFTSTERAPLCKSGTWTQVSASPCRESDCFVNSIPSGVIRERKIGPNSCGWQWPICQPTMIMANVPLGTRPSRSAELYLSCYNGYTFQGNRRLPEARIQCSYGKWSPDPVCLPEGMKYVRPTVVPRTVTEAMKLTKTTNSERDITFHTTPKSATKSTPETIYSTTEEFTAASLAIKETNESTEKYEEECFCQYTSNDEKIVAYLDGKQLKLNDSVRNGSTVNFRCKEVGVLRLVGEQAITCNNCQPWSFRDFPMCVNPMQGDTVIWHDNLNISVDGILEVKSGSRFGLLCVAMEIAKYPEWNLPMQNGVITETTDFSLPRTQVGHSRIEASALPDLSSCITGEKVERKGEILYISTLDIENPTPEHDGVYECFVETYRPTAVQIRIIDPNILCPRFLDDEDTIITYYDGTRVGSKVTFSCRKNAKILVGKNTSTCLSNRKWSDPPPQCTDIICDELKQTDLLLIEYSDGRKIGSFATFHCFSPGQRNGVSRTRCLESGQWSDPTPTCRIAPCSVKSLFSEIPQGIVPNMEYVNNDTVPYNSTVKLTCEEDDLNLKGDPLAKCGKDRKWEIGNVQCVPGCVPLETPPDSKLIVTPEKEIYRFGDFITFACPPGMDLNIELELIMCLRGGWSETQKPECIETSDYDVR